MKKKSIIAIALVGLVAITSVYVGSTYAKYISEANGGTTVDVAKWNVTVKDVEGATLTNEMPCTLVNNDDNIVDGKIAPSYSCYLDVVIDPTGTEVAVDYAIEVTATGDWPTDMAVKSVNYDKGSTYTESEGELNIVDGSYKGTIALVNQNTALTVNEAITARIEIEWANTEANNTAHTTTGQTVETVSIPISVTLSQKIGA